MKKTKIIIPALAMLLLSTAASVSGTVAWFSMNNSVTVTGMSVTTKVSSNLLIAETNVPANYSDTIKQDRSGILEPASTIDGEDFYYTINAKGDGDAKEDVYTLYDENTNLANDTAGKTAYDNVFNNAYGFTTEKTAQNIAGTHFTSQEIQAAQQGEPAYGKTVNDWKIEPTACYAYIDYNFYIKGTSGRDDQVLYMSKCNLLYNGAAITSGYAWRVAVFSGDATAGEPQSLSLVSILGLSDSKNFNQRNTVVDTTGFEEDVTSVASYYTDADCTVAATGTYVGGTTYYEKHSEDAPQAVSGLVNLNDVESPGEASQVATDIDAGENFTTKIKVRLWLEGEDVSCTNDTYADLTKAWSLNLKFMLGDADNGALQNPVLNGVALISSNPALEE